MSQSDVCKLTGKTGKFVKSHLIPRALTRPAAHGLAFIEGGMGRRPVRRWDSWYDIQLTIRAGEDILAELDDWAIQQLRKHRLIWSGWKNARGPIEQRDLLPGTAFGVREIGGMSRTVCACFFSACYGGLPPRPGLSFQRSAFRRSIWSDCG